jgi:mRNA-degrading endonuclease YafQ of YafQ-DinJ toxin-antitoxin module
MKKGDHLTGLLLTPEDVQALRDDYYAEYNNHDLTGEWTGYHDNVLKLRSAILDGIMADDMSMAEAQLRIEALERAYAWQTRD